MSISFRTDIEALPANAPDHHPRVIDLNTYTPSDESRALKIWDAVATMLYTLSPSTLANFLNPAKEVFKLGISPNNSEERIVVWRKSSSFLVGHYFDLLEADFFEWEHVARGTIDGSGGWTLEHASYGLYTKREWDVVWGGEFTKEAPNRGHVSGTDESRGNKASMLVETVLEWWPWSKKEYNWTVLFDCD